MSISGIIGKAMTGAAAVAVPAALEAQKAKILALREEARMKFETSERLAGEQSRSAEGVASDARREAAAIATEEREKAYNEDRYTQETDSDGVERQRDERTKELKILRDPDKLRKGAKPAQVQLIDRLIAEGYSRENAIETVLNGGREKFLIDWVAKDKEKAAKNYDEFGDPEQKTSLASAANMWSLIEGEREERIPAKTGADDEIVDETAKDDPAKDDPGGKPVYRASDGWIKKPNPGHLKWLEENRFDYELFIQQFGRLPEGFKKPRTKPQEISPNGAIDGQIKLGNLFPNNVDGLFARMKKLKDQEDEDYADMTTAGKAKPSTLLAGR